MAGERAEDEELDMVNDAMPAGPKPPQ